MIDTKRLDIFIILALFIGLMVMSYEADASGLKDEWDVHEAIATATAKASHQFNPALDKIQMSFAYGTYDYADAYDAAIGVPFTMFGEEFFVSGNVGVTGEQPAVGVSIWYAF